MHNSSRNDTLVIQIAVAMIILALVWILFIRYTKSQSVSIVDDSIQEIQVAVNQPTENIVVLSEDNLDEKMPRLVENVDSDQVNVVKEYFAAIAGKEYSKACNNLTKCNWNNETAVSLFSREFEKFRNWYEYVAIKDLWFKSPSWKDVVCVKYSYTYIDDIDPQLVSEIMSFYTSSIDGRIQITDRVCEKKYKEGSGNRPCPIEPIARYCIWNVK